MASPLNPAAAPEEQLPNADLEVRPPSAEAETQRPDAQPDCNALREPESDPTNEPPTYTSRLASRASTPDAPQKLEEKNPPEPETTTPPPRTPPELPYSLRDHKTSIAIIWILLIIDSAIMPVAIFYPLWYGTTLDPSYIFIVTTSVFGVISGFEWVYRSWKLWRVEDVRPFGSSRKQFDFFHISYTLGYGIALLELIIGSSPYEPIIRLCATPSPTFILFLGLILLLTSLLHHLHLPSPLRISSLPAGSPIRPATYTIIEDVIAVDTGLGRRYRKAINDRYEASPPFRRLLSDLNLFWGIPAVLVGVACLAVVADERVPQNVAYGIGWGVPPLWAGLWGGVTVVWVQRALRREKEAWAAGGAEERV